MKFFKAPEANAEIEKLTVKIQEMETAAKASKEAGEKAEGEFTAKIAEITKALDSAKAELATSNEKVTKIEGDLATAKAEVTKLQGAAQTVETAAEEKAQQILAGMGINQPLKKETAEAKSEGKTEEQLWAEWQALPTAQARQEFFKKHRAVMGR